MHRLHTIYIYVYIYIHIYILCIYIYCIYIYAHNLYNIYMYYLYTTYRCPYISISSFDYIHIPIYYHQPPPTRGGEGDHMYSHTPLLTYMYIQHCLVLMRHTSKNQMETRWKQMFVDLSTIYNSLVGNGVLFV